jgi:aspartate ammonia-lyase
VVNLGGTAIGTAVGAPRAYIFKVTDELRRLTGLPLARAENLVDATANADAFAEVSGLLATLAVTLTKICDDLRFLSSGPQGGIGELLLPALQEGSSLMPGKVNPVIPEAVIQACLQVMGDQGVILQACARGSLEINPFLPLVADRLLHGLDLMTRSCESLGTHVLKAVKLDEKRVLAHTRSAVAQATALATLLGHEKASALAAEALERGVALTDLARERGYLTETQIGERLSSQAVLRLGEPDRPSHPLPPKPGAPEGSL